MRRTKPDETTPKDANAIIRTLGIPVNCRVKTRYSPGRLWHSYYAIVSPAFGWWGGFYGAGDTASEARDNLLDVLTMAHREKCRI